MQSPYSASELSRFAGGRWRVDSWAPILSGRATANSGEQQGSDEVQALPLRSSTATFRSTFASNCPTKLGGRLPSHGSIRTAPRDVLFKAAESCPAASD